MIKSLNSVGRKYIRIAQNLARHSSIGNLRRAFCILKIYGPARFLEKLRGVLNDSGPIAMDGVQYDNSYAAFIAQNEPCKDILTQQQNSTFDYNPKISIIVPIFNTPKPFLLEMVESVLAQTYSNWELCIADGGSSQSPPHIKPLLSQYQKQDPRIKVIFLTKNQGIVGNSNAAISLATGDFIALLDHDDTLAPFALFEVARAINQNRSADFFYSDEDKISENGKQRSQPHFKPDWSPDTLRSYNYICHLSVFSKKLLDQLGGFRDGFDGSQDYDLILRATEQAQKIVHIPKILYHWRISSTSTAANPGSKMYAYTTAKKALKEHLYRLGLKGQVKDGKFISSYQVNFNIAMPPKISIIIPNKDQRNTLKICLNTLLAKTLYKNYEIIIIENNSQQNRTFKYYKKISKQDNIRVITWNKPFNYSAINNFGVKHAQGDIILLLNNDMEIINPDWLERMAEHVVRKEVGAVGAKLYYPDNTIQHAGVILGIGGVAGHSHKHFRRGAYGYMSRLQVIQNLSAVTGACLMIRKEVFNEIGGFDTNLPVSFNDVDLCLKIRERGYLIVWSPYVELYHHESKTRGYEDSPEKQIRFKGEIDYIQAKWQHLDQDPYYNRNLTLEREDFSLKL